MAVASFAATCVVPTSVRAGSCVIGIVDLASQAEVDNFQSTHGPNCFNIDGRLRVSAADVTNLDGLSGIEHVSLALSLEENPLLVDISGLFQLESVGTLEIDRNNQLTSLGSFSNLQLVTGNLWIEDNPKISSLDGLHNIVGLSGSIFIREMPGLTNLDELAGWSSAVSRIEIANNANLVNINGLSNIAGASKITVAGNPQLQDLNGIGQFEYLERGLFIRDNNALTDLDALSSLKILDAAINLLCGNNYCTSLSIDGNDNLLNLDGLSELNWAIGHVNVMDNPSLSDCTGLETLMNQRDDGELGPGPGEGNVPDVGRHVFWGNNAPGCNSLSEFINIFSADGFEGN